VQGSLLFVYISVDEGDRGPIGDSERLILTYCLSLDLMV
jgi:hypothetical protein